MQTEAVAELRALLDRIEVRDADLPTREQWQRVTSALGVPPGGDLVARAETVAVELREARATTLRDLRTRLNVAEGARRLAELERDQARALLSDRDQHLHLVPPDVVSRLRAALAWGAGRATAFDLRWLCASAAIALEQRRAEIDGLRGSLRSAPKCLPMGTLHPERVRVAKRRG